MRDKKECFAHKNGKCSILNIRKCQGLPCSFHKTPEEVDASERKSEIRRMGL